LLGYILSTPRFLQEEPAVKVAYMFGYDRSSPDKTGWLKVTGSGYEIADDRSGATPFETENVSGRKGWGSPEQWKDFFNSEDELSGWRFHVVKYTVKDSSKDDEEVLRD
jgi:hypothetical protein